MSEFYAHSLEARPPSEWETLAHHEEATAQLCRKFLERIDHALGPWGDLLGRWHDLGKHLPEFRDRLEGQRVQIDHAAAGAAFAIQRCPRAGVPLAFAIAGHHTGLTNRSAEMPPGVARRPIRDRVREGEEALARIGVSLPEALRELPIPELPGWIAKQECKEACLRSLAFFTRMLFSVLVDADRLATEEFYAQANGVRPERDRLQYDSLAVLRDRLDVHIDRLAEEAKAERPSLMNDMRAEVLAACRLKAEQPPGLFSLTVPTGGAKTLSGMSFALAHAVKHKLDRVIVVIPYTSIIKQNADRYREAMGGDGDPDDRNVLEHHSGIDEQKAEEENHEAELRRRLAAENWNAPIVVTTTVQFFESLFSDHPSRCRKLHRITRSVVILDEVQSLPAALLLPILEGLKELTSHYGATVVLSTATPPALLHREKFPRGLKDVRPIIDDPVRLAMAPAARRVEAEWRVDRVTPYEELAKELATQDRVLVVVHRRQDARLLADKLPPEGRYHLSALMCPAHRVQRVGEIGEALANRRMCRIVSTQLIEAGVDIDLPMVYRALAGLDSLAQSAGRCDREGNLSEAAGKPAGRLIVFRAETSPPPGILRKAMETVDSLLKLQGKDGPLAGRLDPFNPEHCELFFRHLYVKVEPDAKNVQRERAELNFANVAGAFRMIEDEWMRPVVVPWGDAGARIKAFVEDPCRRTARALQPFMVQVSQRDVEHLLSLSAVEPWEDSNLYLPTDLLPGLYDREFGLVIDPEGKIDPELLTH